MKRICVALAVCFLVACQSGTHKVEDASSVKVTGPRLVILGFDGVDPRRVEKLVRNGSLKNISKLGATGHRGALRSTNPPQSPVAWAAFATGASPGQHGVFDFIGRDTRSYFPKIATTKIRHAEIAGDTLHPPVVENLRGGESFWDTIARAGVAVRTLSVPYSYPPPKGGARSLAGLGTPDVRGINSSFTLLVTDKVKAGGPPPPGGQFATLETLSDGKWRAMLKGPRIKVDGRPRVLQAPIVVSAAQGALTVELGGKKQTLQPGQTGGYVTISFVPSPKLTIKANTRITVRAAGGSPELYVEPLRIVPEAPYFPLSNPDSFAALLWKRAGPFKTVGWVHDTSALGADAMDEGQFLREAKATMLWREKATLASLEDNADRVLVSVFTAPDRIGHVFYRYFDKEHPARDEAGAQKYGDSLDESYREMDRIIGEVQKKLKPEDTLLIMSDHGFGSFRRGFNINRWLLNEGYLALKPGVTKPRDFFMDVDWSKTKAYALGTGSIFINVRGREAQGIVEVPKAKVVAAEIANKIVSVQDGKHQPIVNAYLGDDLYSGPHRPKAPDVRIAMSDGYRASWGTSLGGIGDVLFENNTKKWSGDHASAKPSDVPGILISNKKISVADPAIEDLSRTAFEFAKVKPTSINIGRNLLK
jgi:predicted AlkP superfamily phosphohydrolase/phosphomutase